MERVFEFRALSGSVRTRCIPNGIKQATQTYERQCIVAKTQSVHMVQ